MMKSFVQKTKIGQSLDQLDAKVKRKNNAESIDQFVKIHQQLIEIDLEITSLYVKRNHARHLYPELKAPLKDYVVNEMPDSTGQMKPFYVRESQLKDFERIIQQKNEVAQSIETCLKEKASCDFFQSKLKGLNQRLKPFADDSRHIEAQLSRLESKIVNSLVGQISNIKKKREALVTDPKYKKHFLFAKYNEHRDSGNNQDAGFYPIGHPRNDNYSIEDFEIGKSRTQQEQGLIDLLDQEIQKQRYLEPHSTNADLLEKEKQLSNLRKNDLQFTVVKKRGAIEKILIQFPVHLEITQECNYIWQKTDVYENTEYGPLFVGPNGFINRFHFMRQVNPENKNKLGTGVR